MSEAISGRDQAIEARLHAFADGIPHIAFITEADGRSTYFSRRWHEYVGAASKLAGVEISWLNFVGVEDAPSVHALWSDSMKSGIPFEAEFRLRRFDNEERWHIARAHPRTGDDGRVVEWYWTCVDNHDQKVSAASASQSKSAFLANISHEIRTPLGIVLGFSELLSTETSSVERQRYAEVIARHGRALTRIIDDILDLSKIEAGRLALELVPVRLEDLVLEVVDFFSSTAQAKGVAIESVIDPELPAWVKTDPTRLRQILVNLIGNAVKFTASGLIRVRARAVGAEEPGFALAAFEVHDSGIGLTVDQARGLFEIFTQADGSTTRKFGGSGLGLALSRRLARALGGDVDLVRTTPGGGSVFVATVAAQRASVEDVLSTRSIKLHRPSPRVTAEGRAMRVLLVDDSEDNRRFAGRVLARAGIDVDLAENGEQGISMAAATDYDVVLMDMQMPVLDGYSAVRTLRARGYRKPILALTAHAMDEDRQRTVAAGCDAHLTKPISREQLIFAVRDASAAPRISSVAESVLDSLRGPRVSRPQYPCDSSL